MKRKETEKSREDILKEIRNTLSRMDRSEERFRPTSFTESLKYNFLGVTPEKEEEEGGFLRATGREISKGFKGLFGIEDKKEMEKERKLREEQLEKEMEEKQKAVEMQERLATNSDVTAQSAEKMLDEVTIIRKVVEGSVKYNPKAGRYTDPKTGQFIGKSDIVPSGTVVEEDDTQQKMLEKLEEIDENTEEASQGGLMDGLLKAFAPMTTALTAIGPAISSALLPIATILATAWAGKKVIEAVGEFRDMREAQRNQTDAEGKEATSEQRFIATMQERDPELLKKAQELQQAENNPEKNLAAYMGQARRALGRSVAATAETPQPVREPVTAAMETSSMALESTPPVVINNVDSSSRMTTTAPASSPSNITVSLRDVHGSHLRFQEKRLTRVV